MGDKTKVGFAGWTYAAMAMQAVGAVNEIAAFPLSYLPTWTHAYLVIKHVTLSQGYELKTGRWTAHPPASSGGS